MKLSYTLLAAAAVMLSVSAAAQTKVTDRPSFKELPTVQKASPKSFDLPSYKSTTRSVDNPELTLQATKGVSYDYHDLQAGNNAYQLILTNCTMDGKTPTSSGQLLNVVLFGPDGDDKLPPAGTYTFNDEYDYPGHLCFGSNIAEYMDVFPHPEDPEAGMVAYVYNLDGGTIEIAENNGVYTITAHLNGYTDNSEDEENPIRGEITASYTGKLEYVDGDPYVPYVPLNGDVELKNLNVSGRYTDGDYNIAFYNVPLDEDGFIIGPGDLMATEIFVPAKTSMNLNDLCGTFTPVDALTEGIVPGHFMQGIWFEYWGNWLSMGTNLTVYQEDMPQLTGLATGGTIDISRDGDTFTVVFDLTTPEENHITGTWIGPIAEFITDMGSEASVGELPDGQQSIRGGRGCVYAPENARVYNIAGIETGRSNLAPGLYMVVSGGNAKKVVVK